MNIHRAQLPGHALGQRANPVFGAGKGRKPRRTAQAGGGAGEQDGAALTLGHALGHFTAIEKS
ncbi:hypothetical protein D3C73_1580070 [compost metagenome]